MENKMDKLKNEYLFLLQKHKETKAIATQGSETIFNHSDYKKDRIRMRQIAKQLDELLSKSC